MNLSLILELTKRDFTERFAGSILGVSWSFIWPLVSIMIYTVIFSKIMSARMPGNTGPYSYGIYLVAGLVPWTTFANTVLRCSTVFLDKKYIISKINISLIRLPLYIVLSESITFVITMLIYLIFLIITKTPLSKWILVLPFVYIVQQIFAFSLGFFMGIFTVFIRDLKEVMNITMQIWFWFTPIVYVANILPEFVKKLLFFNPAYLFIQAYQQVFAYRVAPDFYKLIILTLIAHILLLVSFLIYKKLEKDIRDFV